MPEYAVVVSEDRETQLFHRFQHLDEKVAKMKMEMQAIETELTILAQRRKIRQPDEQYRQLETVRDCVCDMVIRALQTPSMSCLLLCNTVCSNKREYKLLKEILERTFYILPNYNASLRNYIITRAYNRLSPTKEVIKSDNLKQEIDAIIQEEDNSLSPMTTSAVMETFCYPLEDEAKTQFLVDSNIYAQNRKILTKSYVELFLEGFHSELQAIMRCYIKEILISENNINTMNNEDMKITADHIFMRIRYSLLPPPPVVYFKGLVIGPNSLKAKFNQIQAIDIELFQPNTTDEDIYMEDLPSINNEHPDEQSEQATINSEIRSMLSHHIPFLQSYACLAAHLWQ